MQQLNILIINLTRMGDQLQTQAAIADLSAQGHRIAVVCLENFAGAAALLKCVEHVFPLPSAAILAGLDKPGRHEPGGKNNIEPPAWSYAFADLSAWKKELSSIFTPDCVCNLTPTVSARILARYLAGDKPCTGFAVDEHGFGYAGNGWAAFLQGTSTSRVVSPFNISDLFRRAARMPEETAVKTLFADAGPGDASLRKPDEYVQREMQTRLDREFKKTGAPEAYAGFVAFQLGASEDRRRWPIEHFAALGEILWREGCFCPVLLGSAQENVLAEKYSEKASHPFINLCGKTSLEDLSAILGAMRLLITNDTGTMHLAAGLGIPSLSIFLATAQPFDTGPYLPGVCCLEPDLPCHPCPFGQPCPNDLICRKVVSAELAGKLALKYLAAGEWELDDSFSGARAWVTFFNKDGLMDLRSISGHEGEDRSQWLMFLRQIISQFIDRQINEPFHASPVSSPLRLSGETGKKISTELTLCRELMELLVQQGKVLGLRKHNTLKEKFLLTWERIRQAFQTSRWLAPLAVLWMEETQASGQEMPATLHVISQFAQLVDEIDKKINQVIADDCWQFDV